MKAWGINTHCDRMSVAVIDSEHRHVLVAETVKAKWSSDQPEKRVAELFTLARRTLDEIADEHPPALVLIERPKGARNGQDVLFAGWAAATIAAVTVSARHGGMVDWVEISTWRRQTALYERVGAAPGDTLTKRWKAAGLTFAREHGYTGKNTEESDAVGIALAAGVTLETGRR